MAQIDFGETICEAVNIIVEEKIKGIQFDKTINCTIIDAERAKDGLYKVTDGSTKFYAYSASTDYKKNDAVYVTVPNGDFNNQKIIIGKQVTKNTSPFLFTTPFDTMVDVSTNLINDKTTEGYLRANDPKEKEILLWEKDFTENNQEIAGYTRLGIQGQFRSWLDSFKCISGNYGYKLILHCKEEVIKTEENNYDLAIQKLTGLTNKDITFEIKTYLKNTLNIEINWDKYELGAWSGKDENGNDVGGILYDIAAIIKDLQDNRKELSYAKYELFLSSSNDMYGNPYNFETFYQQEKVFDISPIKQIEKMELYFYQEPQSFIDKNGKQVPHLDEFDNPLLPNLFTKDAYICLGYDVATFNEDQANIYCLDSKTYSDHYLLEDNQKYIILRWIHKFEDGRIKAVPDTSDLEYEIRWYRYKLGAPSADEYSGVYWERIEGNSFYYDFKPDVKKEQEQIKAIILFNDKVIRSNILTFTNEKEVINEPTSQFLQGLNIWCKDNTYGNYYIYDPGNKMLEQYDVKQARELVALFSTKAGLTTSEQEGSILTEAKSITWTFPSISSMLEVYDIDYSVPYPNKDASQFTVCAPRGMTAAQGYATFKDANLHTLKYELNDADKTEVVYDHIAKTIEITRYGDINNAEAINPYQLYFIKKDYIQSYANNVIQCSIVKNHTDYFTSKTFYFGQAGTTGTDVTLKIYIDPADTFALTKYTDKGDTLHCKALLFDSHNQEIDPNNNTEYSNIKYEWSWFDYKYDDNNKTNRYISTQIQPYVGSLTDNVAEESANQIIKNRQWLYDSLENEYILSPLTTYYANSCRNEVIISADTKLNMNHFLILQCTVKGWGDYDLTTYKPIAIRNGEKYSFVDCANEVIYLTSGYPEYYKEMWKIHLENIDEDNDGYEDEYVDCHWDIFNPHEVNPKYLGTFKNGVLKPIGIYVDNVQPYGAQCFDEEENIIWTQPIVCVKNNYPSGTLNQWTGELVIDEENGYILAPAIAAGKKNQNNTFSGVMLGDWSSSGKGENPAISKQTGVYGFDEGMLSYALMEDGTAFFGRSGYGRIMFDGNKSTISNFGYRDGKAGMMIDLDDAFIDIKDNSKTRVFISKDGTTLNPFFEITGNSKSLIHISKDAFYLQTDNYVKDSAGVRIDLKSGYINAYDFLIQASGEGGTLTINSEDATYPFDVNGKFKIAWDGGVIATWGNIGGFIITDHSIFLKSGFNGSFDDAKNITFKNADLYLGTIASGKTAPAFALSDRLRFDGSAGTNGKLYIASNIYRYSNTTGAADENYFLIGINNIKGQDTNRLQIGSPKATDYGGVSIYGSGGIYLVAQGENVNWSDNTSGVSGLQLTDDSARLYGYTADQQYGIYARFA